MQCTNYDQDTVKRINQIPRMPIVRTRKVRRHTATWILPHTKENTRGKMEKKPNPQELRREAAKAQRLVHCAPVLDHFLLLLSLRNPLSVS